MITFATPKTTKVTPHTKEEADAKYHSLRIGIRNYVKKTFEDRDPNFIEEIEQSVQVFAYESILSLAKKGRLCDAYATILAQFGIRKHLTGRPGGLRSNSRDVFGEMCKYLGRSKIKHYGLAENITDSFESESTANDGRYPIHRTVALKIDFFENWFAHQTPKDQEIIRLLAYGETTGDVAKKYNVSPAMVTYWRRKYEKSWNEFISDPKEKPDLLDELRELAATPAVSGAVHSSKRRNSSRRNARRSDPPAATAV